MEKAGRDYGGVALRSRTVVSRQSQVERRSGSSPGERDTLARRVSCRRSVRAVALLVRRHRALYYPPGVGSASPTASFTLAVGSFAHFESAHACARAHTLQLRLRGGILGRGEF